MLPRPQDPQEISTTNTSAPRSTSNSTEVCCSRWCCSERESGVPSLAVATPNGSLSFVGPAMQDAIGNLGGCQRPRGQIRN